MGGSQNNDCEILLGTSTQNHKNMGKTIKHIENLEIHNGSPKKKNQIYKFEICFFGGEGP